MTTSHKNTGLWVLLLCAFVGAFLLSICSGAMSFSVPNAVMAIFKGDFSKETLILWQIRLPRALLGALVGATLGLSGAAMQGLLRNPLAEPGIMGVTGGAVFGAVIMFYSGISAAFPFALPLGGMIGCFISVSILFALAGRSRGIQTLILAGIALNTLAFAGTSLALNLSNNPYAALEIVFWQMGSVANRSFDHLGIAFPFVISGLVLLLWDRQALNALSLGEETASSLGISIKKVRMRIILGTMFSVGAAVSVCGSIGFVGLVVPHLLRPWVQHEPGRLLSVSALGGAIMILLADVLAQWIPSSTELKLGVLTSLVGAPFFIALILKMRNKLL